MPLKLTPVKVAGRDIVGAQTGPTISVTSGSTATDLAAGKYLILAEEAGVVYLDDAGAVADSTDGESWVAGEKQVRVLQQGATVAFD